MSYNTPVQILQGGSVLQIAAGGTFLILPGGSAQNTGATSNSGSVTYSGSVSITGVIAAPAITLGGTLGRWAFGTTGLTAGVGTVATGMTRLTAANANVVLNEVQGIGSAAFVYVDLSLAGAGSAIFRLGSLGGALWAANGTVSWQAHGT